MFGLFKKKESKGPILKTQDEPFAPFEILLPEDLMGNEIPDLKIGSRTLDLLRSHPEPIQTLEVFEKNRVVTSNNPKLKEFVSLINGAKQAQALKTQIELMCFPPEQEGSIGILCCLIGGVLNKFHVFQKGGSATINWQFTKVVC